MGVNSRNPDSSLAGSGTGGPPTVWVHEVKTGEAVTFRLGRCGPRVLAEWPRLGTFTCESDGTDARFEPVGGAALEAVEKLKNGIVRALVGALRGQLALHAAAIACPAGAVLFLGPSGAGKSTAAAEMCLRTGAELLADDVVLLDADAVPVVVQPTEEEHWLTGPSCVALGLEDLSGPIDGGKVALRPHQRATRATALALAVALRFDASARGPEVRALRGTAAARSVLEAILRVEVDDLAARRREIEQISRLHESAPMIELVRDPSAPGGVADVVAAFLGVPRAVP